jgi:hypothetical protein
MMASEQKMRAVLALEGKDRYSHFIKVAANCKAVWGLWSEGWALLATDDDETTVTMTRSSNSFAIGCVLRR